MIFKFFSIIKKKIYKVTKNLYKIYSTDNVEYKKLEYNKYNELLFEFNRWYLISIKKILEKEKINNNKCLFILRVKERSLKFERDITLLPYIKYNNNEEIIISLKNSINNFIDKKYNLTIINIIIKYEKI